MWDVCVFNLFVITKRKTDVFDPELPSISILLNVTKKIWLSNKVPNWSLTKNIYTKTHNGNTEQNNDIWIFCSCLCCNILCLEFFFYSFVHSFFLSLLSSLLSSTGLSIHSITLAACNNTNLPVHWRRKAGK